MVRHGGDDTQPRRQRYRCKACAGRFDDLTGTVLAGHHQPLQVWVLCLYFMGLNLLNRQIAEELGLSGSDVQLMTEQLRHGLAWIIHGGTGVPGRSLPYRMSTRPERHPWSASSNTPASRRSSVSKLL